MKKTSIVGRIPKQNLASKTLYFFWLKKSLTIEVISSLLILLFVYAAISKLLDFETFKFQLGKSPYITHMSGFVSWFIPFIELATAFLLAVKRTQLIGLFMSFLIMLLFTGYIFLMLNFSYYIPCSCGGVLSKLSWQQHFIFNIIFTTLALIGALLELHKIKYLNVK